MVAYLWPFLELLFDLGLSRKTIRKDVDNLEGSYFITQLHEPNCRVIATNSRLRGQPSCSSTRGATGPCSTC